MRALTIVLVLAAVAAATAPANADTPPPAGDAAGGATGGATGEAAGGADEAEVTVEEEDAAPEPEIDRNAPLRPPALTRPAGDEPPAEEDAPAPRTPKRYREQVLVGDALAVALSLIVDRVSADGNARPGALATFTIATYFFTAPAIHGFHREGRRALVSFGLRAGLPLLFGLDGEQLDGAPPCETCKDSLRSRGKVIGLTAGVLLAMAIDGALLSRPRRQRTERPRAAWTPAVSGVRGGALAGLAGTF